MSSLLADMAGLAFTTRDLVEALSELGALVASVVGVLILFLIFLSLSEPRRKRRESDHPR